jgi:RNA polymerase sigma-70 factor (ECF subfamily)
MNSAQGHAAPRERFEQIVREYHGKIFNFLYYMLSDREEAADLTQDVFVRAYAAFSTFRGEAGVYTWLSRIARNLAINRAKRLQRERQTRSLSLEEESHDALQLAADDESPPGAALESQETQKTVRLALNALPPDLKEVIVLRDIQGFSYQEMCQIMGCSLQALKSRLFRARGALRQRLAPLLEGGLESE